MLRILRSFSNGAIIVRAAVVAGPSAISSACARASVSSTLGGARFFSTRAAAHPASVIADQWVRATDGRSIRRGLSFTTTARFSTNVSSTVDDVSFLAANRLKQLQLREFEAEWKAALDAVEIVKGRHPSRSLLERLIADEAAWQTMYRHWQKLVDNEAKWEDLLSLYGTNGADKVKTELRTGYGLTAGAAEAFVRVIALAAGKPSVDVNADVQPTYFYYVQPPNLAVLKDKVAAGGFVLFHGPRASGKSSTLVPLQAALAGSVSIAYIDFQRLTVNATLSDLADSGQVSVFLLIEERMRAQFPDFPVLNRDGSNFVSVFTEPEQVQWAGGRKVVLVWDEFDLVFTKSTFNDAVNLMKALRAIKSDSRRVVHGMVAVGTYGMVYKTGLADFLEAMGVPLDLLTKPGVDILAAVSPFNAADTVPVAFFSLEHVREMLRRMSRLWNVGFDEGSGLAERILVETNGHPGSVAVYLRLVQDNMARASHNLSVANFVHDVDIYAVLNQLEKYKSTRRMTEFFGPEHWQLLNRIFLQNELVYKPTPEDRPTTLAIAQEGLLVSQESNFGDSFCFVSPAAREMARLLMVEKRRPRLLPASTFDMSSAVAVLDSVKMAIRYICRDPLLIVRGGDEYTGAKKTEVATEYLKRERDNAPNELTYHGHLLSVLYHWLHACSVHVAVPVGAKTKPDIVISQGTRRVLLELVSHARLDDHTHNGVDEHVQRVGKTYQPVIAAEHAIVVAFYYGQPKSKLWWPLVNGKESAVSDKGVHLIYAVYDKKCKHVRFISEPGQQGHVAEVMC